jgi:cytoskeletal protein CcmA (bactofilin family)
MDTSDIGTSTSRRGRRGAATQVPAEPAGTVVLGPRDSLVGTLSVDGDVRVEGTLEGQVSATGEVTVAATGTARAQIDARDIVITGTVEGRIVAQDLVSVGDTGVVNGEVRSARLRVDEGAGINATIAMTAPAGARADLAEDRQESEGGAADMVGSAGGDNEPAEAGEGAAEASAVFSGSESGES